VPALSNGYQTFLKLTLFFYDYRTQSFSHEESTNDRIDVIADTQLSRLKKNEERTNEKGSRAVQSDQQEKSSE